jgi:hypothetical protein
MAPVDEITSVHPQDITDRKVRVTGACALPAESAGFAIRVIVRKLQRGVCRAPVRTAPRNRAGLVTLRHGSTG